MEFSKLQTAGCIALAAVGIAALGWLFGPPKKEDVNQDIEEERETTLPPPPKEAEKKLQLIIEKLNHATSQLNFEEAEKYVQEAINYTEELWGKKHVNYGIILGIPISNYYEQKKDYKKWAKALLTSASILKYHGEEMLLELGILDKLIQCLPHLKEYSKASDCAKTTLRLRKEAFKNRPTDNEIFLKYATSVNFILFFYSEAGMFKLAEELCQEILSVHLNIDPSSDNAYDSLQLYTNCLHQQGKTEEALNKLEDYKKKIEHYKDLSFIEMVQKILIRAITLSFLIDDYKLCYNYLEQLRKHNQENHKPIDTQTNMDYATVFVEFGRKDEAEKCISEVRSISLPFHQMPPLVRSRYLTTMSCQVQSGIYKLTMKVNRKRPQRKEGELEDPENIIRKLENCFLCVYFQNTVPDSEQVKIEYLVTKPNEFEIESPKMPPHKSKMWYKVFIEVYSNSNKSQILGTHVQLVYSFPKG